MAIRELEALKDRLLLVDDAIAALQQLGASGLRVGQTGRCDHRQRRKDDGERVDGACFEQAPVIAC